MTSAASRSILSSFRAPPYNLNPVVAASISLEEYNNLPCDEGLQRELCYYPLFISETIAKVCTIIRDGEFLNYTIFFFKRIANKIQAFVLTENLVNRGTTATIFLMRRFVIAKNSDYNYRFIKTNVGVYSTMVVHSQNVTLAASRAQAAEKFKACHYTTRTYAWTLISKFTLINTSWIRQTNLLVLMRKYDCDLLDYINRREHMADPSVSLISRVRVLHDITQGLKEIHGEFLHRDLKPDNILVNICPASGEIRKARIADFDLITSRDPHDPRLTKAVGSPMWISPELVRNIYSEATLRIPNLVRLMTPALDYHGLGLILQACRFAGAPQFRFLLHIWYTLRANVNDAKPFLDRWLALMEKRESKSTQATDVLTYDQIEQRLASLQVERRPSPDEILSFIQHSGLLAPRIKNKKRLHRNSLA